MRLLKLTFLFSILVFSLTICGNTISNKNEAFQRITPSTIVGQSIKQNVPQEGKGIPQNRFKYSSLDEDIIDTPLKTEISMNVLIEDSNINKENLKILLEYLYAKTIKRTGFKYHPNPTNIYIYAFTSKDKAKSGMGQWVGMISKSYSQNRPSVSISDIQLNAINETKSIRWNLTYTQRKEIWRKVIQLEDRSEVEADKIYPLDNPSITIDEIKKNGKLVDSLKEKYERELAKEHNIQISIIDSVKLEALVNGWAILK